MTEKEYKDFYYMEELEFKSVKHLTAEQCLAFLRGYEPYLDINDLQRIPEKHQEFCKIQLKLEGLL